MSPLKTSKQNLYVQLLIADISATVAAVVADGECNGKRKN